MTYKKTNRREDDSRGRGAENSKGRNVDRSNSRNDRKVERPNRDEPSLAKRNLAGRNAERPNSRNVERSNSRNDRKVEGSPIRRERGDPSWKEFNNERSKGRNDRKVDRPNRDEPSLAKRNLAGRNADRPNSRDAEKSKGRNVERSNSRSDRSDRNVERSNSRNDRSDRNVERSNSRNDRSDRKVERPNSRSDRKVERPNSRTKPEGAFDKFDIDKMRERKTQSLEKKNSKRTRYVRNDSKVERPNRDEPSLAKRNLAGRNSERSNDRNVERSNSRNVERSNHRNVERSNDRNVERPKSRNVEDSQVRKQDDDSTIRLNRYIANSGVCSRRKADELIEKGEVSVNGEVVRELGYKVKYSDKIKFQGKLLKPGKLVYVLLNKPKDYITTMDDPMERRTVVDLTSKITSERIYPVGRLDRNTTGLLLLTNDGDLADKLAHPRNQVKKVYEVELDKSLSSSDFEKVKNGVELEDGPAKVDQISYLDGKSKKFVGVEIHIGRNRIVRRIFESLGYEVVRLDRVIYAGLTKKDLPRGRCRLLTKEELIYLKHLNKY